MARMNWDKATKRTQVSKELVLKVQKYKDKKAYEADLKSSRKTITKGKTMDWQTKQKPTGKTEAKHIDPLMSLYNPKLSQLLFTFTAMIGRGSILSLVSDDEKYEKLLSVLAALRYEIKNNA